MSKQTTLITDLYDTDTDIDDLDESVDDTDSFDYNILFHMYAILIILILLFIGFQMYKMRRGA